MKERWTTVSGKEFSSANSDTDSDLDEDLDATISVPVTFSVFCSHVGVILQGKIPYIVW